jgi:hypothetical protein
LGVETAIQEQLIEAFHWPSLRQWLGSAEKRHQTPRVFQESVVTDCELRWMRLADLAAGCLLLEGCAHAVVVMAFPRLKQNHWRRLWCCRFEAWSELRCIQQNSILETHDVKGWPWFDQCRDYIHPLRDVETDVDESFYS